MGEQSCYAQNYQRHIAPDRTKEYDKEFLKCKREEEDDHGDDALGHGS